MSTAVQQPLASIPAPKLRRSNKAPALKAAVLIQRANGTPKMQIARELEIARGTVDAIIEEANLDVQLESGILQSVTLIPEAIRVAKHRLSQNSENMAIKVLENTIWPLNQKSGKGNDPHLTLAIQNLMGNVTVGSQVAQNVPVTHQQPITATHEIVATGSTSEVEEAQK